MNDDELEKTIEEILKNGHYNVDEVKELRESLKLSPTPISPYIFKSYIEEGVPYNGPVWGIGNIIHLPDALFCVRPVTKDTIDEEENDWLQKALIDGGVLLGVSTIAMDKMANYWWTQDYWRNPKGKKFNTSILEKNAKTGKFRVGRQGYEIGRDLARRRSLPFRYLGAVGNTINVVLIVKDVGKNGLTTSNVSDTVFGALGFVPGVGWVISGLYMVYTVTDCYVEYKTGKNIKQHTTDYLFTKYVEFQNALKCFLNSMIPYPLVCH